VSFVKAAFDELGKHIKPHSVDYFIASGVIPHLGASLDHIIGRIEKFVAPEGRLHIVSSYHAFDRKMSRAWKRRCIDHPGWAPTCAAATTLLQSVVPLFGQAAWSWYIRNFVWAFQNSFAQNYAHHLEIYQVEPYSVFWSYADYLGTLARYGFPVVELYPYSLALCAGRRRPAHEVVLGIPADATVAVLGDDWLGRWFMRRFQHDKKVLIRQAAEARGHDVVVLAYDYSKGRPYSATADDLAEMGFTLGRSLFLYQMLI
jgi:hypothetical protein